MEALLVQKQLMQVADGSKVLLQGSPGLKAILTFKCLQSEAHAEIILCLEPLQLPHAHSPNLKVIWDELDAAHCSHSFTTQLALGRKFIFLTKKADQSMLSWIGEVHNAAQQL